MQYFYEEKGTIIDREIYSAEIYLTQVLHFFQMLESFR